MKPILDYHRAHSPITNPGDFVYLFEDLPDNIPELINVVQGQLLHRLSAEQHGVTLTRESRGEHRLRTMQQKLARIAELDPSPITSPREPKERQVGMCRDFAVFLTSLLRHKGIPARMRVGFAEYLFPDSQFKADHWITEYWDQAQSRWILADADVVKVDIRRDDQFYFAGSAWKLARAGNIRSDLFRFSGRWKGFPCIRGNLLHDFQALNNLELGLFDYWDDLHSKSESSLTPEDKGLLDRIAELTVTCDDNFEDMEKLFDELPRTKQIYTKLRQLGVIDDVELVKPDNLKPSEIDRLANLSKAKNGESANSRFTPDDSLLPFDHPAKQQTTFQPNQLPNYQTPHLSDIIIRGARQHNLKHIDVHIPRHKLVVITGVSGSGKSSLAFDTIYAEGQRRYVESLSSFARQFMDQMEKPQVDQITGLSPSIAIEQKTISRNPRSTVGTVTEILDYLRVLFARVGMPHCPECGRAVHPQSAQQVASQLANIDPKTRFQLLAPIARKRKGANVNTFKRMLKDGYTRARVDSNLVDLSVEIPKLDKNKKHNIEIVIDRLVIPESKETQTDDFRTRLIDSVETALKAGDGVLVVDLGDDEIMLSEHNACPNCDISFPKMEPHLFSFNSPLGMCDRCNGLGIEMQVDPHLVVDKPHLSLLDGASRWYGTLRKSSSRWRISNLQVIADHFGVDLETPWNELPQEFQNVILYGSEGVKFRFKHTSEGKDGDQWSYEAHADAKGSIFHINRLFRQTKSEYTRRHYMSFMSKLPCTLCEGERLNPEARFVTIDEKRLPDLTSWSIEAIHNWVTDLPKKLSSEKRQIGDELIKEIHERLGFLRNVGLHYLTLDRSAPTLSGGEGQRIRLASQIGSGLVGVLYILDEPSIGLHARDHRALLDTLIHLRDIGNTVLVVEHDEATMRAADWIIDLGPGPGSLGGEVVAAGPFDEIILDPESVTGKYLSGASSVTAPNGRERRTPLRSSAEHAPGDGWLTVKNARLHNLKGIDAKFPLGSLVCITGVSGSGKSSLIAQTVHPALARELHKAQMATPGPNDGFEGLEHIDKVINITQDPIGRNPRSNPGTYVGVLGEIRKVFAELPEAKALGYKAGRFSFNVKGGRCEECRGYGYKKVEMHFLADVWVRCATCDGARFNRQTLAITYKDKNIAEVLDMDVQQALRFFENHPKINRILQTLHDVGLDYVKLGQSALTLSGGEAQRVKLAKELSRVATGRTVYILDEPTTGLHFADIQRLLDVIHRLVDAGNTVIVIEHNLDVIKTADWIIDLGPEGGDLGGYIVAEGTPEDVANVEKSYTGKFLKDVISVQ